MLLIIYLRAQARERAFLILRLVACLGTLDQDLLHFARIGVPPVITQAHAGLHLVDVLSSGTAGTESLPFDLSFVDMHFELVRFGQHGYRRSRGMHASLGLRHRHSLHAMNTGFIFERAIYIHTRHVEDDLFVSSGSAFGERRNGVFESLDFKILGVHAEEVSGKDRRLVTSCTAANLHHHILSVFGILRQELQLQLFLQLRNLRLQFIDLRFRHLFQFGIRLIEKEVFGCLQIGHGFLVPPRALQHPLQVMVVAVETHIARLISYHSRVGDQERHLVKLRLQSFYF